MSSQGADPHMTRVSGQHTTKTQSLGSVRTRQRRIAHVANKYAHDPLTTLGHYMDTVWMHTAYQEVNKTKSTGVDNVTAEAYAADLAANLGGLLQRAKDGSYRATPVKRVEIPKNETEMRTIGIPTFERKVLERAVQMILEPIYEQIFRDCSYGFRPKRSTHQALEVLRDAIKEVNGGWVLDVDIRNYFDSIPHALLREIIGYRVNDLVITRLINKWLKAGVWTGEKIEISDTGTPQGGVISPMLSNIYLHTVLDEWMEDVVAPLLKGKMKLVRFADDFVIVFERKDDALRVQEVLPKRLGKYGLEIHPEKTRLVDFRHPWRTGSNPRTFDFLGFTHYWGKTRKGGYAVQKKTSSKKMRKALKGVHTWCKKHRHKDLSWQHGKLCDKLRGHNVYYGVTGNSESLAAFRHHVMRIWRYWLCRRSRKRDGMPWERFREITKQEYRLPPPRIYHKWNPNRTKQLCLGF